MDDLTPPAEFETFELARAVELTGAPSEDWLMRKIRVGIFPARKAGRHWRMTRSDMAEVVAYMKRAADQAVAASTAGRPVAPALDERHAAVAAPRRTGLTARARRNLARTA